MQDREVTLFTGQWADLSLSELAPLARKMGYDGLELACWGDHFDVRRALTDPKYLEEKHHLLQANGLVCRAISNHLVGQAVCDPLDDRHRAVLPKHVWADGDPDGIRKRAAEEMALTAEAAQAFQVTQVNGFTGSPIWNKWYFFPPTSEHEIDQGYLRFAELWTPIMDRFQSLGVRFGLEIHPTEIAYDIHTAQRALDVIDHHPAFGFNLDPSHLYWQFVDPVKLVHRFPGRIFHVHMKDAIRQLDGETSILGSHLQFGARGRGWDFRSVGRGAVDFEGLIRALNTINYQGPLSVEWEDNAMDRIAGATEAAAFIRQWDFKRAEGQFDAAFSNK